MPMFIADGKQFAQELLSTFSTDLGEVALVPMTGGIFTVTIGHHELVDGQASTAEKVLWDRKRDGGFPGTLYDIFSTLLWPLNTYFVDWEYVASFDFVYIGQSGNDSNSNCCQTAVC